MRFALKVIDVLLRALVSSLLCVWLVPVFSSVSTAAFGYDQMVAALIIVYVAELGYAVMGEISIRALDRQIKRYRRENAELQKILDELRKGDKDE